MAEPKATDTQKLSEKEIEKQEEKAMATPPIDKAVTPEDAPLEGKDGGVKPLEEYTVKELQAMATGEGVFQAEAFTTKQQLIALIMNIRSMKAVSKATAVQMFNPAAIGLKGFDAKKVEQTWEQKRDATKKKLEEGPKGSMMIPLDIGEKRGSYMPIIVNGWRLDYLKGVMHHDVPQAIINIVTQSLNMTAEAGQEYLIDNLSAKIDERTGQPKDPGRLG